MKCKRLLAVALSLLLFVGLLPIGAVSAAGTADLEVLSLDWNTATEVKPGTSVTFSVTVKNRGTAPVTSPVKATFGTATNTLREVSYEGGIAVGETVTISAAPWTAVKGDYMVAVRVNGDKAFVESSHANNTMQKNLRVADEKLKSACESTAKMLEDAGMTTLVFSDDFDSIYTVDTQNTAKEGYKWYVDRPYGAVTLTTADYSVKNGVMTVHNVIPTYNYGLGTVDCGSQVGFTFNTGYLEVRIRIPRPRKNTDTEKGVPAIWTLPPEKLYGNDNHWVEIDWLEYWGDGYYTVCLHEQESSGGTVYQHNKNSNTDHSGLNDGEWHIMGWLWQKGVFITYYDGVEVMRTTYKEGEYASPMHTTVKGELQESAFVHMDDQQVPIVIGGSMDNPMELDYVRVWDGNDSYVPPVPTVKKMDMSEFWMTYLADAELEPYMEANAYNYELLLSGEQDYHRMEMSQKNSLAKFMMDMGQPVYLTLLNQAKEVKKNPSAYTTKAPATTTTIAGGKVTTTRPKPTTTTGGGVTTTTTTLPGEVTTTTEPSLTGPDTTVTTTTEPVVTTTTAAGTTAATKPAKEKPAQEDGLPGWLIGLMCVLIVALIGGGVTVAVMAVKKKASNEDSQP